MKNASTEKTEYTTMKSMDKRRRWQSLIFNFQNFVTEIFAKQFSEISIFLKEKKQQIRCYSLKLAPMIFPMNIYALGVCTRRGLPDLPHLPSLGLSPKTLRSPGAKTLFF